MQTEHHLKQLKVQLACEKNPEVGPWRCSSLTVPLAEVRLHVKYLTLFFIIERYFSQYSQIAL